MCVRARVCVTVCMYVTLYIIVCMNDNRLWRTKVNREHKEPPLSKLDRLQRFAMGRDTR